MKLMIGDSLTVKNVTEDSYTLIGPLVTLNTIDLDGDKFIDETDFGLKPGEVKSTNIYYNHGLDPTVGKKEIGEGLMYFSDDGTSIWIEAQMKMRDQYERDIFKLASTKKLGWSSGTAPHLTEYEYRDGVKTWLKWPLGLDASVTPTPAEYRNSVKMRVPAETKSKQEETTGDDMDLTEVNEKIENLSTALDSVLNRIEQMTTKSKAGYYSETGGKSDKTVKTFGDFLLAVKRGDTSRIKAVYGSEYDNGETATKDITVNEGVSGGYVIPHEYSTQLMQLATKNSPLLSRVTEQPVTSISGGFPSLDQTIAQTAGDGDTPEAAGVTADERNPGEAYTEDSVNFSDLQYYIGEIGGYVKVQKEFVADSPIAIESLLRNLFATAVASKKERNIIRGNGVGPQYLGVLSSPCAVAVSPGSDNLFSYADALNMVSRLYMLNPASVAWLIHPSIWPDIGVFETTGGGGVWQSNQQAPLGSTLLGYPILQSQHSPQANNSGAVILGDWSAYIVFMRQMMVVDYSPHADFLNGKDVWRYGERSDGKPWMKNKMTLPDPQGSYYVSPFVYHND